MPEAEEPLLPEESPLEDVPAEKPPVAEGPTLQPEKETIIDATTFWSGIDAQTSVSVIAPIDAPINFGEVMPFDGRIVFREFPGTAKTFSGGAKLIKGDPADGSTVSLELQITGIMAAIAGAIKQYTARGEKLMPLIRLAEQSLPTIFAHVFKAIKEKSEGLYWSSGAAKDHAGKAVPLVSYRYDSQLDTEIGVNLSASFEGMRSKINAEAEKYLAGSRKAKVKQEVVPQVRTRELLRNFVLNQIPESKYKSYPQGMFASLTMDEVRKLGGDEVATLIQNVPQTAQGHRSGGDADNFWFRYLPDSNTVTIENRRLTDKKILEDVQKIYKAYGGSTPEALYKNIADKFGVKADAVTGWFYNFLSKLTPGRADKAKKILGLEKPPGLEKVAYPTQAWAGPSLEQVGALVGPDKAQLASEWASSLAGKFDYISFPTLVGGPSDIKKLATLPLTDKQRALVEKYRAPAAQMLQQLVDKLSNNLAYEDLPGGEVTLNPDTEEVSRLAEDAVLEIVDYLPSTTSEEDFLKELKSRIFTTMKMVERHRQNAFPSSRTSPQDVMQGNNVPFDTVMEQPELEPAIEKRASLKEDDSVEVVSNNPNVDERYHGKKGKILEIRPDLYMCPEHGPEPLMRVLVSFEPGQAAWFVTDEVNLAAERN